MLLFLFMMACGADKGPLSSSDAISLDTAAEDDDTGRVEDPCAQLSARVTADRRRGQVPLSAHLDAASSCGPSPLAAYAWTQDGALLGEEATLDLTLLSAGQKLITLTVTDEDGAVSEDTWTLEVSPAACPVAEPALELGEAESDELDEASGLVVSRRNPEVLWTHNDSGDGPRLFALARDGRALGTWTLPVVSGDWEDLAWGTDPASGEPQLFIGDVGNNSLSAEPLVVYVLTEPEVDLEAEPADHAVEAFATLTLTPPEPLNVDTLFVDPVSGDLFLLSDDEGGRAVLLRKPAPHADGDAVALEAAGELDFAALGGALEALGGDISPLGDRVVVRTAREAWLWLRDGAQTVAEALEGEPCAVPLPEEPLGEAVAIDPELGGLLTLSEELHQPIWYTPFAPVQECDVTLFAVLDATPLAGPTPLEVRLDASGSCAPEGLAEARWALGDGSDALSGELATHTYWAVGEHTLTLTVVDAAGEEATASVTVTVEPAACPEAEEPVSIGEISSEDIDEASGLVVSRRDAEVLWTHNDSGDSPRVFAVSREGAWLGTWTLDVDRGDWEDIAISEGSFGGAPELWIADVGDNALAREEIFVHRIEEPEIPEGEPAEWEIDDVDTLTLTYPDGARNCETLMLDPLTGDLYLVTKDYDGLSEVYRKTAPHAEGEVAELELVASLTFGEGDLPGNAATTGGEFSPDGLLLVVRTYGSTAYLWRREPEGSVDAALQTEPCPVRIHSEAQGEAICFDVDGQSLLTVSERTGEPIWQVPLSR